PEGQVPGAAQIQHPLWKGGLHPDPDLALEPVDDLIQHGVTSPTPRRQCPRRSAAPPPSWPSGPGGRPGPAARRRWCLRRSARRCTPGCLCGAPDTAGGCPSSPGGADPPPDLPAGRTAPPPCPARRRFGPF
ncbi:Manganese transport regulator MntR, partial [Dysosmobacter welbionis]